MGTTAGRSASTGQQPRRRRCALVLLATVLAVTACGDDSSTVPGSLPTAPASASTSPPTTSPAPSDPTVRSSESASTASPAAGPQAPSDTCAYAGFLTPSRNIRCSIVTGPDGDGARCDIADRTWQPPPKAADCDFDWGSSLYVSEDQSGFDCVSDAVDAEKVLAYGQTEALGDVACRSSEAGVRCEHAVSGRAFELSRDRYRLF